MILFIIATSLFCIIILGTLYHVWSNHLQWKKRRERRAAQAIKWHNGQQIPPGFTDPVQVKVVRSRSVSSSFTTGFRILEWAVNLPTRVTATSSTAVDNVITMPTAVFFVLDTAISDHFAQEVTMTGTRAPNGLYIPEMLIVSNLPLSGSRSSLEPIRGPVSSMVLSPASKNEVAGMIQGFNTKN
ncbi:hypothetical protein J6590_087964 [Homalodisca vitripennis]|nr:hypothetical protein J6590_087964 [Homalodisca vitripennis]